jgi:hypothetical protein
MLYGGAPEGVPVGEHRSWPIAIAVVPVAVLVALGVALPTPIASLVHQAVGNLVP